jgi:hypothetical protein
MPKERTPSGSFRTQIHAPTHTRRRDFHAGHCLASREPGQPPNPRAGELRQDESPCSCCGCRGRSGSGRPSGSSWHCSRRSRPEGLASLMWLSISRTKLIKSLELGNARAKFHRTRQNPPAPRPASGHIRMRKQGACATRQTPNRSRSLNNRAIRVRKTSCRTELK